MSLYLMLGDLDLSENVVSAIKPSGGFWKVKQDSLALHSLPKKDTAAGMDVSFTVEYDDEAEADAFRAYCSSDEVIDAPLYIRNVDWHYTVTRVSLRGGQIKSPMGYLHWRYDVVCYLDSPYASGEEQIITSSPEIVAISAIKSSDQQHLIPGAIVIVDGNGNVQKFEDSVWTVLDADFYAIDVSIRGWSWPTVTIAAIRASDHRLYLWSGSAWEPHSSTQQLLKISLSGQQYIAPYYGIDIDHNACVFYGSESYQWHSLGKSCLDIAARDVTYTIAAGSDGKLWRCEFHAPGTFTWSEVPGAPSNPVAVAYPISDPELYGYFEDNAYRVVTSDGKLYFYNYSSDIPEYNVPWEDVSEPGYYYTDVATESDGWLWVAGSQTIRYGTQSVLDLRYWDHHYFSPIALQPADGPHQLSADNRDGTIPENIAISIIGDYTGHATDIALDGLVLCDEALRRELWELSDDLTLYETYEDIFRSSAKWDCDTVGDGTFLIDHITLEDDESAYYKLSGPWPAQKPVVMTAELSGTGSIEASANGTDWWTVIDSDMIESGQAEYYLYNTQFRRDIYVRFSGPLQIDYVKFEVERKIRGTAQRVAAGEETTLVASAASGTIDAIGTFTPRRRQ